MLTYVTQIRHNECHIAVCLMFIKSLKRNISYKEIKNQIKGCSFYDMREILLKYGIKCASYNINLKNLKYIYFSYMIVQCNGLFGNHMLILEKEKDHIYYYDPAKVHRKKLRKHIIKQMTGNVLLIHDDYDFEKYKTFNLSYNFRIVSIFSIILAFTLFIFYYLNY